MAPQKIKGCVVVCKVAKLILESCDSGIITNGSNLSYHALVV